MKGVYLLLLLLSVAIFVNTVHAVSALEDKIQRCKDANGTVTYVYGDKGQVTDVLCTDSKNNGVH